MSITASIRRYLADHHVHFEVVRHDQAFTALEDAAAAHVSGYEWAKTVVVLADGDRPVMAVLPANYEVDLDRLRRSMGVDVLRIAHEWEFTDLYPGCEPGAMPPLGPLYGQPVWVDQHLADDETITFNGGNHMDAIRIRYADYDELVHPRVSRFGRLAATH